LSAAGLARAAGALVVALLAGAALWLALRPPPPVVDRLVLSGVGFAGLPGWQQGRQSAALPALLRSCVRTEKLPPGRTLGSGELGHKAADWGPPCTAARALRDGDDKAARQFFETWFEPFAVRNNARAEGLFTGYYEPELAGSRNRGGRFTVPIHARPDDLVTVDLGRFRDDLKGRRIAGLVKGGRLQPYASRADIDAGALAAKTRVLAWVDDPIAAFFLHVQGSGRVALEDGDTLRVGYAGHNGHPYVAIGRELIARGELSRAEVSLQTIRAWLAAHPDEAAAVMALNPSYIFFRPLKGDGPVGAQGVALTPGRSLAVDRRYFPLGLPLWLDASAPAAEAGAPDQPLRRLMVAQDTGGAIRGPVRGDVFWGHGAEAEAVAGRMKHPGRYFVLLPKS
jgi:membrane-bound lytic murein transglycosylase A